MKFSRRTGGAKRIQISARGVKLSVFSSLTRACQVSNKPTGIASGGRDGGGDI